jgi:hypothetical protein
MTVVETWNVSPVRVMDMSLSPNGKSLVYVGRVDIQTSESRTRVGSGSSQETEEERDRIGMVSEGRIGFYDLRTRREDGFVHVFFFRF